jgi:hypothetical protein
MGKKIFIKRFGLRKLKSSVSRKVPVSKNAHKTQESTTPVNINKIPRNKETPFTLNIETVNCNNFTAEINRLNCPVIKYPSFSTEDSKNEDFFSLSDPNFNNDLNFECERFFLQNTEEIIPNDLDNIKAQGNFHVLI